MPQNWQRPLISALEREIQTYLDEMRGYDDLDLAQEVSAKIADALIIYRRHLKTRRNGEAFTEERMHQLTEMAFSHAFARVFGDEANDVIED